MPGKSMDYQDMEDEEKKFSLPHLSEKLAIAFSLTPTSSRAPICNEKFVNMYDSHLAIKFTEIVVKDHFKKTGISLPFT